MTLGTTTAGPREALLLVPPNGTGNAVAGRWVRQRGELWLCFTAYRFAVLMSFSIWFLAIRAPLWLDETASYWSISGGFRQIWSRSIELNSFPAYYYILSSRNLGFPGFPAELSCEIAVPMMDLELFGAQDDESMK